MKVRLPQQGGQQDMLRKVQKLQEDMQNTQAELEAKEYEVSSGGGMVKVVISGTRQIKSISISPAAVDPDDVEMLQDLVTAAVNEAISTVDKDYNDTMGALTGGLNIPGLGL